MIAGMYSLQQDILYKAKVSTHGAASAVIFDGVWLTVYEYTAGAHIPTDNVLEGTYTDLAER